MGYILHCFKCFHRETIKGKLPMENFGKCRECGSKLNFAGPLWLAKISDRKFCELMGEEFRQKDFRFEGRIGKILALITSETEAPITYYVVDKLCDALTLPVPPVKKVINAMEKGGFPAFLTHFNPKGVKSNMPAMEIKEILREMLSTKF